MAKPLTVPRWVVNATYDALGVLKAHRHQIYVVDRAAGAAAMDEAQRLALKRVRGANRERRACITANDLVTALRKHGLYQEVNDG